MLLVTGTSDETDAESEESRGEGKIKEGKKKSKTKKGDLRFRGLAQECYASNTAAIWCAISASSRSSLLIHTLPVECLIQLLAAC